MPILMRRADINSQKVCLYHALRPSVGVSYKRRVRGALLIHRGNFRQYLAAPKIRHLNDNHLLRYIRFHFDGLMR